MDLSLHESNIKNAVNSNSLMEYKFGFVSDDDCEYLTKTLEMVLKNVHMSYLQDEVNYILMELIANANKANLKRIYFKNLHLNIYDLENYEAGMKNFIKVFQKDYTQYQKMFDSQSLYTKALFQVKDKKILIISPLMVIKQTIMEEKKFYFDRNIYL